MNTNFRRLVIISGPSGVGKTKLLQSFRKFYPEISAQYESLVYYVSRLSRPDERNGVDRFFLPREEIEKFKNNSEYIVASVRHDLHAVCLNSLLNSLKRINVIYEGSPFLATELLNHPHLKQIEKLSIFISPISKDEILLFNRVDSKVNLKDGIMRIISMKLLKRALKQKNVLSIEDYEDISIRSQSAVEEIKFGTKFDWIITNHDGEEHENWDCFYYPIGDARKTLFTFIDLLNGNVPEKNVEKWEDDFFDYNEH